MSGEGLAILATVIGTGAAVVAMIRFEARRITRRVDRIARAAGIAAEPAKSRPVAHETGLAASEPRSVQADAPMEHGLEHVSGIRAMRETDS